MELTDLLIDILEDLYTNTKQIDKIVAILTKSNHNNAPSFLEEPFTKVERAIIQSLGGTDQQYSYFLESDKELSPFIDFRHGKIDKDELIRQIKMGIAFDLKLE